MVTPTPPARPFTAATIGVRTRASAGSNGLASSGLGAPAAFPTAAKSARSLPAVNMSPLAMIKMQRISGSVSALVISVASVLYMARVSAFFLSGRFNVRTKSFSDFSTKTCCVTKVLLVCLRRRLAQAHDEPEEKRRSNQTGQYAELHFGADVNQARRNIGEQQQQCSAQCGRQQYAAGLMAHQRTHQMRRNQADKADDSRDCRGCANGQCRAEYRQNV